MVLTLTSFQKSGSDISAAPAWAMRDGEEINNGLIAPKSAHNSHASRNTKSVPPPIRYLSRGDLLIVTNRHPEVAAKRPSKDAAEAPGPSPFEARGACHRAGHFGPDPLARTSG